MTPDNAAIRRWDDGMSEAQKEERRERAREWRRQNKERHQVNTRAYRKRNPERHLARNAVYFAIKRGELVRQPCEVCGEPDSHAHHDDYGRRLDVRWLCSGHHVEADVARRNA
jgi:formylmethanofuran dehydrogenase subunit E